MINNQTKIQFGQANDVCTGRIMHVNKKNNKRFGVLGFMNKKQAEELSSLDIYRDCPVIITFQNSNAVDSLIKTLGIIRDELAKEK